jgi:nicotinamide mononucleotide (NMN) deamidase PncC
MMKTDYAIATSNAGPSKGDANADLGTVLLHWPLKRNNRRRI